MKKCFLFILAVLLFSAVNFPLISIAQTKPQFETKADNNSFTTAMPVTVNPLKLRGNIFPIGDVDYYAFQADSGDRIYAAVMTAFSAGISTDCQMSLISSDGATVIESDDDNGSFASLSSSIAGAVIPDSGTYYIKVNDFSATGSERGYDLYLRVESGSPVAEVEGNNAYLMAGVMSPDGYMSGTRNPADATEQDWFAFTLNAGESVFISLDLDPERDGIVWNGRVGLALFGDFGTQILVIDDAGSAETPVSIPSEALFITVKDSGTYYVYVDASAAAVGGPTCTYHLSVSRFAAMGGYVSYPSSDIPKTIGPAAGSVASTIMIPDNIIIKNLSVRINLTDSLMADLDAILTTPDGNSIHLFSDIGSASTGGQIKMDLFFNDYNAAPPYNAVLKGLGFTPELGSKLDQLEGMNAAGTWTLTLFDDLTNTAGGILNNWSLEILEDTMISWIASRPVIYSSDFEATDGGFTHSGTGDEFEWGTPATIATTTSNPIAGFTTAHSGVNCWKTDLDNTYNVSSDQILLSPSVTFPSPSDGLYVSWAMKYQMEAASYDNLTISIEEVGGSGLTKEVFVWLGATETALVGNPAINVPLASGWGMHYADITEFAGKTVQLKVRLVSDNSVNFAGIAIDDVRFAGCGNTFSADTVSVCDTYVAPDGYSYSASGDITAIIPNVLGCDSTISIALTVTQGTSETITESACNSYTAPDGAVYTASGIETAVIPNMAGCDSTITIDLTVNSVDTSITVNGIELSANATGASSFQWVDCDNGYQPVIGALAQVFTPSVNGNYAVIIDQTGCTDTSDCYGIYTVNVASHEGTTQIAVYPNPTSGSVTVSWNNGTIYQSIAVYSVLGTKLWEEELQGATSHTLNLGRLNRGIYFIHLMGAENTVLKITRE